MSLLGVPPAPGTPPAWLLLVVGGVAMVVFVRRQLTLATQRTRALLDLRTFGSRNFTISLLLMAILMLALFGTIILLPIYLQNVLGLSMLQTGLLLLPGGLVMGLLGPRVGRYYDKVGPDEARDPRHRRRHGRALGHDAARHAEPHRKHPDRATSS